jgi:hypothetical protein
VAALAGAPTKSSVCALTLSAMSHLSPRGEATVYTLNTLRALKENYLEIKKINGDTPEGFSTSHGYAPGFGQVEIARRITGIELFATNENKDTSKQNFTKVLVLSGRENIHNFIVGLKDSLTETNKKISWKVLDHYKLLFTVASLLIPIQFMKLEQSGRYDFAILAVLAALAVTSKADHFLQRPLYKDREILNALKRFEIMLNSADHDEWALFSRNAQLGLTALPFAHEGQKGINELTDALADQSVSEVPSIMRSIEGGKISFDWVGIDMFLESRSDREPELHVIFRGSEKRPVFPQVNENKKDDSEKPADDTPLLPSPSSAT